MLHRSLPGDLSPEQKLARMVRVDHAGEYGAKRIYAGQLAVRRDPEIEHMAEQEEAHLAFFDKELVRRQVRPTLFHPVWHVAGFALGAATALLGPKAAMACTAAVEDVIDEHYARQVAELQESEPELAASIEKFRQEEAEHKETALEAGAAETPFYSLFSQAIKIGCRAAIWTAERV
jgi:ubiquinone biosynthesis monooxygenase Coq7